MVSFLEPQRRHCLVTVAMVLFDMTNSGLPSAFYFIRSLNSRFEEYSRESSIRIEAS